MAYIGRSLYFKGGGGGDTRVGGGDTTIYVGRVL